MKIYIYEVVYMSEASYIEVILKFLASMVNCENNTLVMMTVASQCLK